MSDTAKQPSGDISPEIAAGDESAERSPAETVFDSANRQEQAAIAENQRRLDESGGETEVTVDDAREAAEKADKETGGSENSRSDEAKAKAKGEGLGARPKAQPRDD